MTTAITPDTDITYTATLTSPLHHGAGTAGNTSLLRTQDIVTPDGRQASVPYVSGNSVRHQLRDALAWHAVRTLGIGDGGLTKAVVDLLWSGGAVTTTGAQVDLTMSRRVDEIFPALGLLGYAAHSDIVSGTLRVSSLHLLCAENAWRAPDRLRDQATVGAARYRGEEFGTRHDVANTAVDRYVDTLGLISGTTQMIYDMQVLKPGAILWGEITTTPAATDAHQRVLRAAMQLAAPAGQIALAAKTAVGYGRAVIDGWPDGTDDLAWWTEHLTAHATEVVSLWSDLAS